LAYRDRVADDLVRKALLQTFGAVILQGPRAVGKTTSGLQLAASSVRLDSSPNVVTHAEVSPGRVLEGPTPRLIDEWQLAPTLWNAVRHEVDDRGIAGQFILTGSATPSDDVTRHSRCRTVPADHAPSDVTPRERREYPLGELPQPVQLLRRH